MIRSLLLALGLALVATGAHAACPVYPYTLTNGTPADADQVMANFNAVTPCLTNAVQGPGSSIVNEIASYNNTAGTLLRQGAATATDARTGSITSQGAALAGLSEPGRARSSFTIRR